MEDTKTADVTPPPESYSNNKDEPTQPPSESSSSSPGGNDANDEVPTNLVGNGKDLQDTTVKGSDYGVLEETSGVEASQDLILGDDNTVSSDDSPRKSDAKIEHSNHLELIHPEMSSITVRTSETSRPSKLDSSKSFIDTRAPISSVKQAVSKFGGIVDWKAHKLKTVERRKQIEHELEKAQEEIPQYKKRSDEAEESKEQALKDLDACKRLIEELKLNLERAQTEEQQAKQDSELAKLRVEEMEQGITDDSSVAAKTQLEVARARHAGAVSELQSVNEELEVLHKEFASLLEDKEEAIKNAEAASSAAKEAEKAAENLTIELIATKESLESAQSAHLEAEELMVSAAMAREQDSHFWEKELRQAEEELKKLHQHVSSSKDLKFKLETASTLLVDLKSELAAYMESRMKEETELSEAGAQVSDLKTHTDIQEAVASAKKELEEVKSNIEKGIAEIDCLKVTASSLQNELQKEKAALVSAKQREGMAAVAVSALEAELKKTKSEISAIQTKAKEIREKMVDMPMQLQQAGEEADLAKSRAEKAREELHIAKEELEQAKAEASTIETKLIATQKEIEAVRASEKLAIAAVKALQESESARITNIDVDTPTGITLSLEEYYELSKRAQEAEEEASLSVASAISQIEEAKESEMRAKEELQEVNKELASRKEALKVAQEKAEEAKEKKLGVEQELRNWRSQQATTGSSAQREANPIESSRTSLDGSLESYSEGGDDDFMTSPIEFDHGNSETDESKSGKKKKKKKKSLIPRIFMFMGKKKHHGHSK